MARTARCEAIVLVLALLCTACATRTRLAGEERALYDAALDRWIAHSVRLQTISERLQLGNTELCGEELAPILGIVAMRARDLPDPLRRIGEERLGRTGPPSVVGLVPGSAAQRAGVRIGDRVLAIDGSFGVTPRRTQSRAPARSDTIAVRLRRGGRSFTLMLASRPGCRFPSELIDGEAFNAYATGRGVVVFAGMLRILQRDAALAFVLGHEIAHDLVYAREARRARTAADEARADYLGAYLAERAGYRLERGDFGLARAAAAAPDRELAASPTHPSAPARLAAFERTLQEIEERRANGAPMIPDGF